MVKKIYDLKTKTVISKRPVFDYEAFKKIIGRDVHFAIHSDGTIEYDDDDFSPTELTQLQNYLSNL